MPLTPAAAEVISALSRIRGILELLQDALAQNDLLPAFNEIQRQ